VLVGEANRPVHGSSFGMVRYLPNGALDPSFGNGGIVTTSIAGHSTSGANDVAIQSNGRIVLAGFAGSDFALARYLSK
jgi:Domain of unknown function (DUF5122) beta-propeller